MSIGQPYRNFWQRNLQFFVVSVIDRCLYGLAAILDLSHFHPLATSYGNVKFEVLFRTIRCFYMANFSFITTCYTSQWLQITD